MADQTKWSAGKQAIRVPQETNVWTAEATTHQCPKCGSHDTRKSYTKGAFDTAVRIFGYRPYRCRKCSRRFIRKDPAAEVPAEKQDAQQPEPPA